MKKELIISILIIMIGVSLTFGCTGTKTTTTTATPTPTHTATPAVTQTATPTKTAAATPVNVEVQIKGFAFEPATVNISVGDTVIWKNVEKVTHQIKIDDVESPILTEAKTFSYTFNETGSFNYTCTIHPSMKGTVIVK
jgi:plastocyanin